MRHFRIMGVSLLAALALGTSTLCAETALDNSLHTTALAPVVSGLSDAAAHGLTDYSVERAVFDGDMIELDEYVRQVNSEFHPGPGLYESGPAFCENAPVCRGGLVGGVSYLKLKPSIRGLDYALTEDGTSLTVGRSETRHLDLESDSGIRAHLGYRTTSGWTASFRYTSTDFMGMDEVVRPDGIGQLFATRSHPDGNEEGDTASALGSLDFKVFDLEASRQLIDGPFASLSVFGGVRWTEIASGNTFRFDGRDFVNALIQEDLTVQGAGLQFGTECSWKWAHGFAIVGKASAGLMKAKFETARTETNVNDVFVLVDSYDEFDQVLPNIELAAGLRWQFGPVSVGCNYEVVNWFNAYDRGMFIDDIHEASYGPFSSDILLDGLSVTFSYSR